MSEETLHLPIGYSRYDTAVRRCKLHPVVILEMLDHFVRRNDQERVIGTLLGVNIEGVIEIRSSFPVPYTINEDGMIEAEIEFHRNMYDQKRKANAQEVIVGWYSTGKTIDDNSVLIHDFYWREMASPPVHMIIDPLSYDADFLGIRTYVAAPLGVASTEKLGFVFQSVELDFESENFERIGVDILLKGGREEGSLLKDLDNLELSIKRLLDLLQAAERYVKNVLQGKEKEDAQIGRMLWDTISSLPKMDAASFEKMWNNSLTDLLMVVYLANLTKTQILTTEKLQALPALRAPKINTKN